MQTAIHHGDSYNNKESNVYMVVACKDGGTTSESCRTCLDSARQGEQKEKLPATNSQGKICLGRERPSKSLQFTRIRPGVGEEENT